MEIVFENLQKKATLNPPQILKTVKTILQREGVGQASLSIVFVSHQRIQALNKKFLGRAYATDVLAFDLREGKGKEMVGDIIISTDAALKNSRTYKTKLSEELALYMIHGILHLLGFDDHKPQDIKKMRRKEQQLLAYLGAGIKGIVK